METGPPSASIHKGFLLALIFVVGIGAINFGYAIGVFNSMQDDFIVVFGYFNDTKEEKEQILTAMTTISSVGMAIGALFSAPFTKFGKKNCIHFTNILVLIACGLCLVKKLGVVLAGRFLYGVAGGAFSVFVPSFINEVTPVELKGPFGSSTQILITLGIMIANLLGIPFPSCENDECKNINPDDQSFIQTGYWRVLFAIPMGLSVVQSILLFTVFNYETPKFLKQNGRSAELNTIMGKIYSHDQVQSRIDTIIVSSGGSSPSYKETLTSPKYMIATIMGCTLSLMQQLSGINIVMFYSSTILKSSGGLKATQITALVGVVNCLSVFPTIVLFKKFGRKTLLWVLSFAIAASLIGLGVC